jgi:hypothetical protein
LCSFLLGDDGKSCLGHEKDWLFDDKSAIILLVSEKTGKGKMNLSSSKLPAVFVEKMKDLLGIEYAAFAETLSSQGPME